MQRLLFILCFLAGGVPAALGAEMLAVGAPFPAFHSTDQHGADYTFEPGARVVLIAFEMGTARAANRFLAAQPATYLDDHRAVYIADIYGMPAIGRHFALPKMRRYPQRIILADAPDLLAAFPREKGRVTVLGLDDAGVIRSVGYWNPETAPAFP